MGKFAEGKVANVVWGARFGVANGLRWVADRIHEDMRYRVSGCTYRLVPGEGVKVEWGGQGVPLLYREEDHELFHPEGDRWVPEKEVEEVAKEISKRLLGTKWTRDEVAGLVAMLNVRR